MNRTIPQAKFDGKNVSTPDTPFSRAQARAAAHGIPDWSTWQSNLERRYDVLPTWFWDEQSRKVNYVAFVDTQLRWQKKQARVNEGGMGLGKLISPEAEK